MISRMCRVCGDRICPEPLFQLENMPGAAQHLPDAAGLAQERGVDLTVGQCSACGLVQLDAEPVPYYRDVIRAAGISGVLQVEKTAQFAAFIDRFGLRGGKIVEIGCGHGEFLARLPAGEVDAYGLEHDAAAVAVCRARGLTVFPGYPEHGMAPLPPAPFDAFLLLMFLEHMPDPRASLQAIGGGLSEGAVGIVEVPSFDFVVRHRLFAEFIGDHLCYFTEQTLRTTLELGGFQVLECGEIRGGYVLSATVRKRARCDLSAFAAARAKLRAELHGFLDGLPGGRAAVWGAGHQAFAAIALTGLAGRLAYVVDSAPFKQGRFTPATHLPIVPPETLRTAPVDGVIVMAGGYSEEIAAILRRDFEGRMRIAVLRDSGLERL
jgi:SAM-dependent methyltransferase